MGKKQITENDKLKEASKTASRMGKFIDEEIARWEEGKIDRQMLCAGMDSWISAQAEIYRIQHDERMARMKKEKILVNKDELLPYEKANE